MPGDEPPIGSADEDPRLEGISWRSSRSRLPRRLRRWLPVVGTVVTIGVQPVSADEDGNALGETIVWAITEALYQLTRPIRHVIEEYGHELVTLIVHTPNPNAVFEEPTNDPWPAVYGYYWETILPLSLFLYGLSIGLVILLESTSHLFGSYHRTKLKKRAFAGLLGILLWWWLAALSLQFANALTLYLAPDLSDISLFQTLSFTVIGVLGGVLATMTDFVLFVLVALIYLMRQLALYTFVLLMPILIALWVPGVGPMTLVSRFVRRLAGFYVPMVLMTVPVALLFRIGELLGDSLSLSLGGIGSWILALVVPVAAVAAPIVMFWQAGALFFVADRASRRVSRTRASGRMKRVYRTGRGSIRSGRDFTRGVRGKQRVGADNNSETSQRSLGHMGGKGVNRAGSWLKNRGPSIRSKGSSQSSSQPTTDRSATTTSDSGSDAQWQSLRDRRN